MEITNIIAIGFIAATVIMLFFGVRSWWPIKTTPKAKSGPSATTTAGTSGGAAAATTTSPAPTPTPTPAAASPRSYSWVWWIIIIIAVVLIGRWVWYEGRSVKSTYLPPQVVAPKPQLRQYVVKRELKFVGGDGAFEKDGLIEVQSDRPAFFATHTLPWRKDAAFHVVVKLLRKSTGQICLEINGGRGGTKFYMHPGSSKFATVVFFETGERGDPSYFNSGPNQIKIWSSGDGMDIQCVSIEMIYRE